MHNLLERLQCLEESQGNVLMDKDMRLDINKGLFSMMVIQKKKRESGKLITINANNSKWLPQSVILKLVSFNGKNDP